MKKLRFELHIKIADFDTGEVLCENSTDCYGSTQSVVHATKGISAAVTHAFEIAGSTAYMEKQKEGQALK